MCWSSRYCPIKRGAHIDSNISQTAQIIAIFENAEDARAVINNPNFRSILDTLCK